jgi:hypothetical protein
MPNPPGDDLSEMLNELAESQKRQEAELTELSGGSHSPPPLDPDHADPIDAVLAEESSPAQGAPATTEADAVDENAIATERIEPPAPHRPVDDLIDMQHAQSAEHDVEAADMLAQLAQQTGGGVADEPAAFPDPAAFAEQEQPQVLGSANSMATRQLPTPRPAGRSGRPARTPGKPAANLNAVFAPVLLTLGTITLLPAIWAVLILMGVETWMHDGQGVDTMAKIMLACWPVSLGLLAGGVMALVQVSREKTKQRKRDEALAARR